MSNEQEPAPENEEKKSLYLPLQELDKCSVCNHDAGRLRLCAACGEIIYCSSECQAKDWPSHKASCGKTDRIDLEQFYPFLAFLAEASRYHTAINRHIGQAHRIELYPTKQPILTFPDGTSAGLILLTQYFRRDPKDTCGPLINPREVEFWGQQIDPVLRTYLGSRLRREGYAMPILLSTCISLLTEMYSTTAVRAADSPDNKARRRVRLQYKKSPISDFGLLKCKAVVPGCARFAYYNFPNGPFEFGPDPNDHWALYFTTLSGEEVILDFNLFPFGLTTSVKNAGYTDGMPLDPANGPIVSAPVVFIDNNTELDASSLIIERKYTILRNEVIQKATVSAWPTFNRSALSAVVESILEKKCTPDDIKLIECWAFDASGSLNLMLSRRGWAKWPAMPEFAQDTSEDVGRRLGPSEGGKMDWVDYIQGLQEKNDIPMTDREVFDGHFKAFKERQRLSLESSRQPDAFFDGFGEGKGQGSD